MMITPRRMKKAFTLVEMLVSMAILTIILFVVASMTDQVRHAWQNATSRIQEFSGARTAFETITRQLSQATLNTYWDYVDINGNARASSAANLSGSSTFVPYSYARQSELRFVTGFTSSLSMNMASVNPISTSTCCPLHAVFFQAPIGSVESTGPDLTQLGNLLNSCGYFIQYGSDAFFIPQFLTNTNPPLVKPRNRFRLMEYLEPSNALQVYSYTSGAPSFSTYDWFADAFGQQNSALVHVLAENVIALILLPKLSYEQDPTGAALAPGYAYDSGTACTTYNYPPAKNQLPPEVQVTLVAIDEPSAMRLAAINPNIMPNLLGPSGLFQNAANYQADLDQLQANLLGTYTDNGKVYSSDITPAVPGKMNYRIFSTNVIIRAAKFGGSL